MNNDTMQQTENRQGRRGLWSRISSGLAQIAARYGGGQDYPVPGQPDQADATEPEDRNTLPERFASQLYANLLLELPQHRQAFTSAWLAGDWESLADCSHRLAGAVAYCGLPELGTALADLENAIRQGEEPQLRQTYNRASRELDNLMAKSGIQPA